jgi:RNA polymerase sigma factor (sigma-70 family)
MMSVRHSISQWIAAWRGGDQRAADELWRRYYPRAIGLARKQVRGGPLVDEEDIAAQALHSLLQRTARGNYSEASSRDDFWRLLITITRRKAVDQYRHARRLKRRGEINASTSEWGSGDDAEESLDRCDSPLALASYRESLEQLLGSVDDDLRAVIEGKMAGYTNVEIAALANCSVPTVERRLRLVRQLWMQEALVCPAE